MPENMQIFRFQWMTFYGQLLKWLLSTMHQLFIATSGELKSILPVVEPNVLNACDLYRFKSVDIVKIISGVCSNNSTANHLKKSRKHFLFLLNVYKLP